MGHVPPSREVFGHLFEHRSSGFSGAKSHVLCLRFSFGCSHFIHRTATFGVVLVIPVTFFRLGCFCGPGDHTQDFLYPKHTRSATKPHPNPDKAVLKAPSHTTRVSAGIAI